MKKRTTIFFSLVIALVLAFAGCSSGMDSYGGANGTSGTGALPSTNAKPGAKIIKTAYMDVETEQFDSFIDTLYNAIEEKSAYTDSDRISGTNYAIANITIRVPAENLDALVKEIGDNSGIVSYSSRKEDVSLEYETLVAKSETLTQEVSVLETLFEDARNAGNFSAVAEIEKRLTEVKTQLAETNAQIRVYDNRVAYSTIYLTVTEVKDATDEKDGAFLRIGKNLKNGFVNVWFGIVEVFVFIISAVPYLLVVAIIASAIILPIYLQKRLKKRKQQGEESDENPNPENPDNPS